MYGNKKNFNINFEPVTKLHKNIWHFTKLTDLKLQKMIIIFADYLLLTFLHNALNQNQQKSSIIYNIF